MNLITRGLIVDNTGSLYQAGSFSIDLDVDAGPNKEILSSLGSADYFYIKSKICTPTEKTLLINSYEPYTNRDGTIIAETGEYSFLNLKDDGCDSTTIIKYKRVVDKDILESIQIHPSPFYSSFFISSDCGFHNYNVSLYSDDAKLVYNKLVNEPDRNRIESTELSNAQLVNGIYFLYIKNKEQSRVFKIVKM
jgi:hypothetical protein